MHDLDIQAWLQSLGLSRYAQTFADNHIDGEVLPLLDDADLEKLGVHSLGHRKKLLAAISGLHSDPESQAGPVGPASSPTAEPIGERRAVTVMFVDIDNFTKLSTQYDPEELHTILEEYFEAVDGVIQRYGGHVDKHIGDAVMGLFGAPVAHTNDPERAVRAACDIRRAVHTLNHPLRVHIGIASGSVVASGTGSTAHREYTVTGPTVNLAARLQDLAGADEIAVSESVHGEVHTWVESKPLDQVVLKGIATPVSVWRIERLRSKSAPLQRTPFVGRRGEIEQSTRHLATVREHGRGHLIYLRGEAGIGKSRLVAEFCSHAAEWEIACHSALVLDFGDGDDLGALADLVGSMLGVDRTQAMGDRAAAVAKALDSGLVAPHSDVFLYHLLDVPKPPHLRARYDAMSIQARRDGKSVTVCELATALARKQPQLLVVEDLHWATSELVAHLVDIGSRLATLPVLLVVTSRIQGTSLEVIVGHGDIPHTVVDLGPLPAEEARDLAKRSLTSGSARIDSYVERAGGNPLFLEQLLRNVEEGAHDALPDSIQGIVLARIDRLKPADKRALQAASVLGQRFSLNALHALVGALEFSSADLIEHQLIQRVGESEYLFAHALVHEGVYSSLLREHRRHWHVRAAEFFAGRNPALHAEHLDRAEDERAPQAYLAAARALSDAYRHQHALELCRRGLELAGPVGRKPAPLMFALNCLAGDLMRTLGDIEGALVAFFDADPLAVSDKERLQAWLGSARCLRVVGRIDDALAILDRAQPVAEAHGDNEALAAIHHLRGNLLFPRGDLAGCRLQHTRARDYAHAAGSAVLEAEAVSGLADAAMMQGRFRLAREYFDQCLALCSKHGLAGAEPASLATRGYTRIFEGRLDDALADCMAAVAKATLIGAKRAEIIARGEVASVILIEMGRLSEAETEIETSLSMARELGVTRVAASLTRYLGVVRAESNQRRAGLALIEAALTSSRGGEFAYMGASILGALARYTEDSDTRQRALAEGEAALRQGAAGYNHIFFYRDAIEACFLAGDPDGMERYADALDDYSRPEQLALSQFLIARGRLLARHLRDGQAGPPANACAALLQQARNAKFHLAASALTELM